VGEQGQDFCLAQKGRRADLYVTVGGVYRARGGFAILPNGSLAVGQTEPLWPPCDKADCFYLRDTVLTVRSSDRAIWRAAVWPQVIYFLIT